MHGGGGGGLGRAHYILCLHQLYNVPKAMYCTWSWFLPTRGFSCSPAARTELASPLPKAVSWSKLSRPIPQTNGTHNHGLRDVKAPSAAAVHFTIEDESLFVPLLLFLLLLFSLLLSSSSPRVVWGDRVGEW